MIKGKGAISANVQGLFINFPIINPNIEQRIEYFHNKA